MTAADSPEGAAALADAVAELGGLALAFGRIDRTACYHPDQVTAESDTDHTVMLAWVAPSLAALLYPRRAGYRPSRAVRGGARRGGSLRRRHPDPADRRRRQGGESTAG